MSMIRTCAYCDEATYDEDPIDIGEVEGVQLRLWVCSTTCAYSLARNTTLGMTTLRAFRAHFSKNQLEEVAR
jgi:hypothetical protein